MQTKAEVTLGYGASGTGKTYQIKELIEYVWERYHKVTRVVTADGGWPAWLDDYKAVGMADIAPIGAATANATEWVDRYCQGYWRDEKKQVWTKEGIEKVGAYAFEGLTSMGDLIMADLRGRGAKLSQDPNFTLKIGETTYYGSNMTYFGFVQERLYDCVMKTHMLPVHKVYWTATETKGEDDGNKVYGPAIAGKKSIGKAPQWFGDCLHFEMIQREAAKDAKTGFTTISTEWAMYLQPHADPITKIVFPAKIRLVNTTGEQVPEYFNPPSLRRLFELEDKFRAQNLERLKKLAAQQPVAV